MWERYNRRTLYLEGYLGSVKGVINSVDKHFKHLSEWHDNFPTKYSVFTQDVSIPHKNHEDIEDISDQDQDNNCGKTNLKKKMSAKSKEQVIVKSQSGKVKFLLIFIFFSLEVIYENAQEGIN